MKLALIILGLIVISLGILEGALRFFFGFGHPPLYVADAQIGYRLAPNQHTKRFGNRLAINQYSMRGPQIALEPAPETLRVLLLGDSIANGGWWTDQADILSAQIQRQLIQTSLDNFKAVEVLNASANSWGPRNELAYLAKFGTFEAQVILLLINMDDLFATAPTSVQVGRDRAYPARRPPLGIIEVLSRFTAPTPIPELADVQNEGGDRVGVNLEAIRQIKRIAQENNSELLLAMTPLLREVVPPGSRDYELQARDRLQQLTAAEQIPYVDFLSAFQAVAAPKSLYRDHIHLTLEGNVLVSQTLTQAIKQQLATTHSLKHPLPDSLLEDPW